ncbi:MULTISPECIES: dihydrofolate reductase family protein [Streptomyces]|uniref:Dihydrofolate reductase family protein n=1 Tax=Streptomyces koelreuteriae TaxID=2838015 RepID=A0ABX8FU75_9ACTN|nr:MULTISPECIES: dihydrofolate reductase family protein [Streptomyces]QWB24760.1 dihydrofolate reductase family protein [Streptomyces koelreuteriae]UUA07773.1 dihydrofolate reductase family protein [Streptomyces koelreuteriae]UUA15402.1 dihydrofolate reductase family protein [Streptomyces sp. CRCS-T-1]
MKLVVQEFLTLDGVSQGPGAPDEDTSDGFERGGWFVPHLDEEFERLVGTWLAEADALLLGRRTYQNFARDWPTMTDHPAAAVLNGLPKYVASHSLTTAGWNPTTILSGDVPAQVAELKRLPGREIQIHGSARLAQSLLAAGLVDTLRLAIAPVVVGQGRRLFPDGGAPAGLRLTDHRTTPGGLSVHVFEATGVPEFGTYGGGA